MVKPSAWLWHSASPMGRCAGQRPPAHPSFPKAQRPWVSAGIKQLLSLSPPHLPWIDSINCQPVDILMRIMSCGIPFDFDMPQFVNTWATQRLVVSVHSGGLGVFGGGESAGEHTMLGVCLAWKAFYSYPGWLRGRASLARGLLRAPALSCSPSCPSPGHWEVHHLWDQVAGYFYWLCGWLSISPKSLCSSVLPVVEYDVTSPVTSTWSTAHRVQIPKQARRPRDCYLGADVSFPGAWPSTWENGWERIL